VKHASDMTLDCVGIDVKLYSNKSTTTTSDYILFVRRLIQRKQQMPT